VWTLGDCAVVPMADGSSSPPTAQHATRQAAVLAHNIVASRRGGALRTFDFKGLGKMGSLGHRSAVAELPGGIKVSGFNQLDGGLEDAFLKATSENLG